MIKNERQYKITSTQDDYFSQALRDLEREEVKSSGVHPLLLKARKEAIQSQLADLEDDLREYEALSTLSKKFVDIFFDRLDCG